jgi:GT2 family glycosyltransferase
MDISIIIVNWQSAGYLAACLDSVLKYPPGSDWECIVIDNASYDGSAKLCIEKYPFVQFIQSDKNIGFAGANNRAIANGVRRSAAVPQPGHDRQTRGVADAP